MSTAPQQDLLSNLVHNRNQWFPTYLLRSVVSLPLRVLLSSAIPLCLQFAVVLVPCLCLLCLAPLRPKCPIFRAALCLQVHTALLQSIRLFRGALTSSQANTWAKSFYDAAVTCLPYTHVKNASNQTLRPSCPPTSFRNS